MKTPTIYEIKEATRETAPHFFTRSTLKFWGQTLKMFSVTRNGERVFICAGCWDRSGKFTGYYTRREYIPTQNGNPARLVSIQQGQ